MFNPCIVVFELNSVTLTTYNAKTYTKKNNLNTDTNKVGFYYTLKFHEIIVNLIRNPNISNRLKIQHIQLVD